MESVNLQPDSLKFHKQHSLRDGQLHQQTINHSLKHNAIPNIVKCLGSTRSLSIPQKKKRGAKRKRSRGTCKPSSPFLPLKKTLQSMFSICLGIEIRGEREKTPLGPLFLDCDCHLLVGGDVRWCLRDLGSLKSGNSLLLTSR
ncbi:hypothetical protein CEXT_87581 [Caerostris extrusa]|uniref:Uncharacterized protein n=1 Tax=Caerostris extrusa TaxID=172846 RepID=A0AAV4Y5B6_CAEEX|nr:hypothetical protein CEXT_87581 [Caerostris extrusa]